mmetsp:Transcript_16602/g.26575  ORF Transcript_16602/g.26575 Transcript_16602/m.26575 type:complete len:127 (+) Transcript_16602:220-600(+)
MLTITNDKSAVEGILRRQANGYCGAVRVSLRGRHRCQGAAEYRAAQWLARHSVEHLCNMEAWKKVSSKIEATWRSSVQSETNGKLAGIHNIHTARGLGKARQGSVVQLQLKFTHKQGNNLNGRLPL